MKIRRFAPALVLLLVVSACAPGELPTPTPEQVEAMVEEAFPGAGVQVGGVDRLEQQVRAQIELDGADMVLVLDAGEETWAITGLEQGERTYTIEELAQLRMTVDLMDAVSDALTAYRQAEGGFPLLDDLVGLRDLLPDYYAGDDSFVDGWGNPLRYRVQGEDYTLTSSGPDGTPATADDVILVTGRFEQG